MQDRILNGPLLFLAVHVYASPLIPVWALGLSSLAVVLVSVLVQCGTTRQVSSSWPWISSSYQLLDLTLTVLSLHKLLGDAASIFLFMPLMVCCMLDLPIVLQTTHFLLALVVGTLFFFLPSGHQYAVDSYNPTVTWLLALLAGMPHAVSGSGGSYPSVLMPKLLYAGLCTAGLVSAASASALYVRIGIACCFVLDRVKMFQERRPYTKVAYIFLAVVLGTSMQQAPAALHLCWLALAASLSWVFPVIQRYTAATAVPARENSDGAVAVASPFQWLFK